MQASLDRQGALAIVERHGWNATAFQTLESGYTYVDGGDDACVAYVDTGRAWVAAGAPIAPPDALARVARAFAAEARAHGRRAAFFAAEARLLAAADGALGALRIGEQPVWAPADWEETLAAHRSLREQLRRARAKGVRVRALSPAELERGPAREAIVQVIARWMATRGLAPMDFLVRVEPFGFASHRRCFVAEVDDRVVGFAGVVPVPARRGWFLEDLVRDTSAPNGTNELLVDAVMRWAASEGCAWLTLGLAPLAGDVAPPLRLARRTTALLYDFEGLRAFKAKFRPAAWTPIYLAFPRGQNAMLTLVDGLSAFTDGGLLRFGARTLMRRRARR